MPVEPPKAHARGRIAQGLTGRVGIPATITDLRCAACGYGVATSAAPAACPMCQGAAWDPAPWRPFSRSPDYPRFFVR